VTYVVVGVLCIVMFFPMCLWAAWELREYWAGLWALVLGVAWVMFGVGCLVR
jgi:hypothetical protein